MTAKLNGHAARPPSSPKVLRIVSFLRRNGFEEKAALLEDVGGLATLRIFDGMTTATVIEKVPFSEKPKRGCWSFMGGRKP